jgi:hypothetical protein
MPTEPKTKRTTASVAAFLNAVENEQRRKDAKAVAKIMAEVSGEKAAMWGPSIVGYGSYKGPTGDWPLIAFSPRKAALVVYAQGGAPGMAAMIAKLGKVKASKGCVYINKLSDVDEKALRALMAKTLKYMREKYP